MIWMVCNWCGARLTDDTPHAVLKVAIVGRPSTRLVERDEARPTLHLCVGPTRLSADDLDRMGLDDETADGGCYAKALAFIGGRATDPPDMGMEWRLVPTDTPATGPSGAVRVAPTAGQDRLYGQRRKPGGIYDLCDRTVRVKIPLRAWHAIQRTEIVTVDQLEAVSDAELLRLDGVGVSSLERIREAIAVYRQRAAASATSGRMSPDG